MSKHDASSITVPYWLRLREKPYLEHFKQFWFCCMRWYKVHTENIHMITWFVYTLLLQQHILLLCPLDQQRLLTLCEDRFTSNIQVSSHFNQLALFTKRDLKQLLTGFQIEHTDTGSSLLAKLALKYKMLRSLENVWTHQSLNGFLPSLWIRLVGIDHPLFLNFIMWEEQYQ